MTAREIDINGFMTVENNPIIREGVFPYLGQNLDPAGRDPTIDPRKIYQVYRPASEISSAEAIESFKLLPFVDEHAMLGPSDQGYTAAEKKGVAGTTSETVACRNGIVYAGIKIFSEALANLIKSGKVELSLGYRCLYDKVSGVFRGQAYDFVQRAQRGNHLALVEKGRNGVAVLDNTITMDHLDLNFKPEEPSMPTIEELAAQVTALDSAVKGLTEQNVALKTALDEFEKKDKDDKDDKKAEDEDDKDDKKDDKKAEDADEEEKKKKDCAMDAAIKRIDDLTAEVTELKKGGIKSVLSEVSKRDALAGQLAQHVGTFDHADMTLDEVAAYGIKNLQLECEKGHEHATLNGYLKGRATAAPGLAMDTAHASGVVGINKYLKKSA